MQTTTATLTLLSFYATLSAAQYPAGRLRPVQDKALEDHYLATRQSGGVKIISECCTVGGTTVCCTEGVSCQMLGTYSVCTGQCEAGTNQCADSSCCPAGYECDLGSGNDTVDTFCRRPDGGSTLAARPTVPPANISYSNGVVQTIAPFSTANSTVSTTSASSQVASQTSSTSKGGAQPAVTALGWGAAGFVGALGVMAL